MPNLVDSDLVVTNIRLSPVDKAMIVTLGIMNQPGYPEAITLRLTANVAGQIQIGMPIHVTAKTPDVVKISAEELKAAQEAPAPKANDLPVDYDKKVEDKKEEVKDGGSNS